MDEVDWEEVGSLGAGQGGVRADEKYTMERAKETAESSSMMTSEQEEKQTFTITCKRPGGNH